MEALIYSFLAGVSTVLGAAIVMLFGRPSHRLLSALLGFAGGVMLAVAFFDLLPESLEFGSVMVATAGFFAGAGIMYGLDRLLPHAHFSNNEHPTFENVPHVQKHRRDILRVGYLVFLGLALHNLPEGLAIGAGLEASPTLGLYIAIAIALHNIPEGIAAAGILRAGGLTVVRVLLLTLVIGLMTPLGAAIGLLFFHISPLFIAAGMAFAAGAMVYIVADELIPQSHRLDDHVSIGGLILGLMVVFLLTA